MGLLILGQKASKGRYFCVKCLLIPLITSIKCLISSPIDLNFSTLNVHHIIFFLILFTNIYRDIFSHKEILIDSSEHNFFIAGEQFRNSTIIINCYHYLQAVHSYHSSNSIVKVKLYTLYLNKITNSIG